MGEGETAVKTFLLIIFILVCIAATVIIMMQEGKDAGLGTIGGIGDTYWGKNKARSMEGNIVRATKWLAAGFLVVAIILNMMPDKKKTSNATETTVTVESEITTEAETAAVMTEAEAVAETAAETAEAMTEAVQSADAASSTEVETEA